MFVEPRANEEMTVVTVADALRFSVATETPPLKNVTVPTGSAVDGACGTTVAVNNTGWPNRDGDAAEATEIVVAPAATTCVSDPEAAVKFASPAYAAVIG